MTPPAPRPPPPLVQCQVWHEEYNPPVWYHIILI